MTLVEVSDFQVTLDRGGRAIVDEVGFTMEAGEIVALVGESGSGKTTIGTALLGFFRSGASPASGRIVVDGQDVLAMDVAELRAARGSLISYVPQDPTTALNPALRVGEQVLEVLAAHRTDGSRAEWREEVRAIFAEVQLPSTDEFLQRFPHQLSGGQQQRVCIAASLVARPRLIVFDEPTTGLDVTTQAYVLDVVRSVCSRHDIAALYITHDLAVVAAIADRVMVAYSGHLVETGRAAELFAAPREEYTRELLEAIPDLDRPRPSAAGAVAAVDGAAPAAPVLAVKDLTARYGRKTALHGVELSVRPGHCLAVVGESGSGKTTLGRCIIGLMDSYDGAVELAGETLPRSVRRRTRRQHQELQYVFQNPYASLNPRQTIGHSLAVPLKGLGGVGGAALDSQIGDALEKVRLPRSVMHQYPGELSGGERQRVAIARALASGPKVLVCDEITSALDVSVQASIVDLLHELQVQEQLALLFVTHNLALTRWIADEVMVMRSGRVVESGPCDQVLTQPTDAYTQRLLDSTPRLAAVAG
ncbi:ABC transporter ATP-binding protein [Nocardioides sp. GY 10127]|uniref:dipeptide ABC transporter ATP-binding protein n=1 Tax=Nocardioides sp. GY 10127 TaxID=2569762 RepID=UPI0010A85F65|nr:ABC transporter ATP-binding protein [Nocardioides sp. GY 10127]TIC85628.1 ABC transporter ATP-binding protein [Nocardioides sp. GY 10127]